MEWTFELETAADTTTDPNTARFVRDLLLAGGAVGAVCVLDASTGVLSATYQLDRDALLDAMRDGGRVWIAALVGAGLAPTFGRFRQRSGGET